MVLGKERDFLKVVLPFHKGDAHLVFALFERFEITEIPEDVILLFPAVPVCFLSDILFRANRMFKNVKTIFLDGNIRGWPSGPNYAFLTAIRYIKESSQEPFLFMEPDAVPLKVGWLSAIDKEYRKSPKPFMGSINSKDSLCHFSGVGVYPCNAYDYWKEHLPNCKAFDMINQKEIVPLVQPTKLIYNFWGKKNLPPVFKENREKHDPENIMTLSQIPKEAVLFHRVKCLSLHRLLKEKGL